jgi:hypothetical protein
LPGGVLCCPAGTGKHRPTTASCAEYVPKIGLTVAVVFAAMASLTLLLRPLIHTRAPGGGMRESWCWYNHCRVLAGIQPWSWPRNLLRVSSSEVFTAQVARIAC